MNLNNMTLEEKIKLHELYKYYGIRDAYFTSEDDTSQRYSDELDAMNLLIEGKFLPDDLATRLLQYKAEDEANKTNK